MFHNNAKALITKPVFHTVTKILLLLTFFIIASLSIFLYFEIKSEHTEKYNLLNKLITEVQINYFTKYLGKPVFINYSKDKAQKEYIFVNEFYYVQTITDSNDKVLAYTVTVRDKDFNPTPTFNRLTGTNITLGKTSLKQIRLSSGMSPMSCVGFLFASNPPFYYEKYYYGRPGHYQTYLFGIANSGYININYQGNDFSVLMKANKESIINCDMVSDKFRQNAIINSYSVVSKSADNLIFGFGPEYTQVWNLPN